MNEPIAAAVSYLRPRKTVLIAFAALWAVVLQHYLLILLFPDGGLSTVRTVLDSLLSVLMFPVGMLQTAFEPMLRYDRFPGSVSVPLLFVYFYLLATVIAVGYEYATGR